MSGYILSIIIILILEAFFSGTETAMVSCNQIRIRSLLEKGDKRARIIWALLEKPQRFLATTLVGTNICVVTSSALATSLFINLFPEKGPLLATVVMVPLVLIFGEMIPKTMFRARATQIILIVAPLIAFFQKILFPIVKITELFAGSTIKGLGVKKGEKTSFLTKEDIKMLVEQTADEGVLEEDEEEAIHSVFEFRHRKVGDVMVNLNKTISVNDKDNKKAILEKTKKYGFTRFPIFKNRDIIGIINVFDLFYHDDDWHKYIRHIRHIDVAQRIDQLFSTMKPKKETMAAVTKKSKLIGIVTVEDIMEEVVLTKE